MGLLKQHAHFANTEYNGRHARPYSVRSILDVSDQTAVHVVLHNYAASLPLIFNEPSLATLDGSLPSKQCTMFKCVNPFLSHANVFVHSLPNSILPQLNGHSISVKNGMKFSRLVATAPFK